MHTLIICGTPWCDLSAIFAQLQQAGLSAALPATSGSIATVADWHRRLVAGKNQPARPMQPGKAWELAAAEIFLANWEQPLWGWADERSTWLLDFWLQFDAQTRFVLVHTPAADALVSAALQSSASEFDPQPVLDTWCAYQDQMLRFYLRHRDRCSWLSNPLVGGVGQSWGGLSPEWRHSLNLTTPVPFQSAANTGAASLLRSLAVYAVQQHEQAAALQSEMAATLPDMALPSGLILGGADAATPPAAGWFTQVRQVVVGQVQALQVAVAQEAQIAQHLSSQLLLAQQAADSQAALAATEARVNVELRQKLTLETHTLGALQQQLSAASQAKADAQARLDALGQTHAELQARLEAEARAKANALEEAELLLAQLHQVQEELESVFLQSNAQKQQLQEQTAEHAVQLQIQEHKNATAQGLVADLNQKLAAQTQASAQSEQQLQNAQAQIQQLGKEQATLQQQLSAASQTKADAQARLDALGQTHAELQARLEAEARAKANALEEAELLLAQLHQVQEELEHYFLKHQQAQLANQQLQDRLARWAERYPEHCEWDSLAVLPHTQPNQQDVLITQVRQAGREFARLHLQLHHTKKQSTLTVLRDDGQPAPLLSWPRTSEADAQPAVRVDLLLDPTAKPGTPEAALLASLAPSDLQLLKAVCKSVAAGLPGHTPHQPEWAVQWRAAAYALNELPPVWRFDALSLRHEQVNPDYEHLWLRLTHAQYGNHSWPEFEFRLSASNVRKNQFSKLPKLEFPLHDHNGPKQFENWFEESEDDKGPKFELRFDIKAPAMDIQCWNALSPQDQAQALDLVKQLPSLLHTLENTGTRIHRPWGDWHRMVSGIQHALLTCLELDPQRLDHEATAPTPV